MVNDLALIRKRRTVLDRLRAATGSRMLNAWNGLDAYTDDQQTRFVKAVAPTVTAAQSRAVDVQIAYLQRVLGGRLTFDRASVLAAATIDLRQPFTAFANALSSGSDFDAAVESGGLRAEGVGESSVTWAARAASSTADDDSRVIGWTRVLDADSCEWCQLVSEQTYHTAESASFGHLRCHCEPEPVIGPRDPGRALNAETVADSDAKTVASDLIQQATAVEPQLTEKVRTLADRHGGEAVGLDFRLKTEESLARKIAGDVAAGEGTAAEVAAKMFDLNRYTILYADDAYAASVQSSIDTLRAEGNQLNVKNYWTNETNPYQGVNVQVTGPAGNQWELQFHTPTSIAAKEGEMHSIYEASRVETDPAKLADFLAQSQEISAKIPVPPGIGDVS